MEITKEQLQKFIIAYEHEFGVVLTPVEAQKSFSSLLSLMALSVKPLEFLEDNDTL